MTVIEDINEGRDAENVCDGARQGGIMKTIAAAACCGHRKAV
jgi:hypothetical protein